MRSRTSFFNTTVFAKSMGRFWFLWAAYFAVWLLSLPLPLLSAYNYGDSPAASAAYLILDQGVRMGVVASLLFAGVAAMAVWSFLYTSRSAYGTACLPLTRETLFFSNTAAGLVPLLGANLVIALLTGLAALPLMGAAAFGAAFEWFGAVSLMVVFFYGFATLCAMLTGNLAVMPLVYLVLNFTAYAVELLVRTVLAAFVYGFHFTPGAGEYVTRWLSPAVGYFTAVGTTPVYAERAFQNGGGTYIAAVDYTFYGWGAVIGYAVAGLVLFALALLLLRRRRMETAGDVVAVSPLKPVFRWCMALGCGLVLAVLMYYILPVDNRTGAFVEMLVFLFVGAFVGWFAAQMLMQKSFRVFTGGWGGWAGFGLCCAVIAALMFGMRADLFGYERYVPPAERVESVWIHTNGETARLETPEGIAQAAALHGDIIADKAQHNEGNGWVYCYISYDLKDGGTVQRVYYLRYDVNDPGDDALELQELLNCPEAIAYRERTDIPFTRSTVIYGTVSAAMTRSEGEASGLSREIPYEAYGAEPPEYPDYNLNLSAEEAWELYSTCILPDMEDGTLGRVWILPGTGYEEEAYDASVYITAYAYDADGERDDTVRTVPTVDSRRTNAWLEAHGVVLHRVGETTE